MKSILKKSWKTYKKNFFTLALAQLGLFFVSLFFLVFVRGKMKVYLAQIQTFQPHIDQIAQTLDKTNPTSIAEASTILSSLNVLTKEVIVFALVIVPIVLFLLWVLFQAWFWYTIKKDKIKQLKIYLLRLAMPTLVVLLLLFWIISSLGKGVDFFSQFDNNMLYIFLSLLGALYFLTLFYSVLENQEVHHALMKTFSLMFKKIYKYLPLYLPLFINTMIILWLLIVGLTQKVASDFSYLSASLLLVFAILFLNISKFYKILFYNIVKKE